MSEQEKGYAASTKIFVCCHGDAALPEVYDSPPYVLVGGGGYKSERVTVSDDTGKNVSRYNPYLSEMSVMYWAAENCRPLPDFIGFAHYRRYLDLRDYKYGATEVACAHDVFPCTVRTQLMRSLPDCGHVLGVFIGRLHASMPEDCDAFVNYLDTEREFHRCNLFVMPRSVFTEYWAFMRACIDIAIAVVGDEDIAHARAIRVFSHILERVTSFWLWHRAKTGLIKLTNSRVVYSGHYPVPQVRRPGDSPAAVVALAVGLCKGRSVSVAYVGEYDHAVVRELISTGSVSDFYCVPGEGCPPYDGTRDALVALAGVDRCNLTTCESVSELPAVCGNGGVDLVFFADSRSFREVVRDIVSVMQRVDPVIGVCGCGIHNYAAATAVHCLFGQHPQCVGQDCWFMPRVAAKAGFSSYGGDLYRRYRYGLANIFTANGSDKMAGYGVTPLRRRHCYDVVYAPLFLFLAMSGRVPKILEVGVEWGASLRSFVSLFPSSSVYGIDTGAVSVRGATVLRGDGYSANTWKDLPSDFDIIIDDATHRLPDMLRGIPVFLSHLREDGFLVIEDIGSDADVDAVLRALPPGAERVNTAAVSPFRDDRVVVYRKGGIV